MKLIIGLGNPGKKYDKTWHNLGFAVAEEIQKRINAEPFRLEKKFQAEISAGRLGAERIILAKPKTFMNESGRAAALIAGYYKIAKEDIIVIHDDIDLPLGKIRLAQNSSAGGHNGVKSIIDHLAGQNFTRVKIGVQTEKTKKTGAADYVLGRINFWENRKAKEATKKAASAAVDLLSQPLETAMNIYN